MNHSKLIYWIASILLGICGNVAADSKAETASQPRVRIEKVFLKVSQRELDGKLILKEQPIGIRVSGSYALITTGRGAWLLDSTGTFKPLNDMVAVPKSVNWFQALCPLQKGFAISVDQYDEARRQKDLNSPRGGFRSGPDPVGMLIISTKPTVTAKFLSSTTGKTISSKIFLSDFVPSFQDCVSHNEDVYAGGYGYLVKISDQGEEFHFLELDDELLYNRYGMTIHNNFLWYIKDEGGLGEYSLRKMDLKDPSRSQPFDILNQSGYATRPDQAFQHQGSIFVSSAQGIVEILEKDRTQRQYLLSQEPKQNYVYGAFSTGNEIAAMRADGWISIDIRRKRATHYRLKGVGSEQQTLGLARFGDTWLVGTEKGVYQVAETPF